jgi:ubiquitin-protein ligase
MELLSSLVDSYCRDDIKFYTNADTLNIVTSTTTYKLRLQISGEKMVIEAPDDRFENLHLLRILSAKNYNNVNYIFDLLEFISKEIKTITNYCSCCFKKMNFQSDKYITCGDLDCNYQFEELIVGRTVLDKVKDDPNIVHFLVASSAEALKNRPDIFEPFPTHFLKTTEKVLTRGQISKLSGKNYDNLKDFERLNKCMTSFDFGNFLKVTQIVTSDYDLAKLIGVDVYKLIRFIILSCKVDIVKDHNIHKEKKDISIYRILHASDIDSAFMENAKKSKSCYLFHGSGWHNWHSILRNGLKNCSQTALMTTGAAYGNGIYLSDDLNVSIHYGNSNKKVAVGVFEVIGEKTSYQRTTGIYVVADEKLLLQRYLIMMDSAHAYSYVQDLNNMFNIKIHEEKAKTMTVIQGKGVKKIIKEYQTITGQKPEITGFRVVADSNNMYVWKIYIFGYDPKDPVGADMVKYGIKEIELELKFPQNYPMSPPFVRVIKPRFEVRTGHITTGGSICMQILVEKYWTPACSVEALITSIKSEILKGDGRLDAKNYNIPYSERDAQESFIRVARGHGWL